MKNINTDSFTVEVLENKGTVIVDFWAEWCGPCRRLGPILEEIANERDDVMICKINVDENGDLAEKYNIRQIPTLLVFKSGTQTDTVTLSFDKKELNKELNRVLGK